MKQLKKTLLTLVALLAVTTGAWAAQVELKLGAKIKNGDVLTFGDTRVHFTTPCERPYQLFSAANTSTTVTIGYDENAQLGYMMNDTYIAFTPLVDVSKSQDGYFSGEGEALGLYTGQTIPEYVMVTDGTGTYADPFILTSYATYNCDGSPVDGKAICDASSGPEVDWATDETLLTTITPTGDGTYSETTAGAVTVTPAGSFFYSGSYYGWRWDYYGSLTVTANEGYTIARCVFIQQGNNQSVTISDAPFALNFEEYLCYENTSMDGVTSIEVYGYAPAASASGPTVTFTASDLADGSSITKDGVTLTGYGQYGINMNGITGPGEFTNSLGGNFTKIVVTADNLPSGDGWSAGTWTGSASSVSFTGNIDTWGNEFSIVCTLETASSGPEVAWDKAEKTGTFKMPGGNVELEPEYYPQAALTAVPTAINDVPATTDGAIVNAGTVKNIGETANAQGTVMYYVSTTALDDAALLALAADAWTADVPTAESFTAAGEAHVYYYVRGNDGDTDDEIFSDGDILSANALTVTIAAAPTYAVTFADDTAEPDKWTASPKANVTKGETVTVTYSGSKKVLGVKAEKKGGELSHALADAVVGEIVGTDGKAYAVADKDNLPDGVTAAGLVAYKSGSNGLVIALTDEASSTSWSKANGTSGAAAHTPTVTGYSWKLPSRAEWRQMFSANGGDEGNHIGLNTALGNAGGTALQKSESYWSSTVDTQYSDRAYTVFISASGTASSNSSDDKGYDGNYVRACLAF